MRSRLLASLLLLAALAVPAAASPPGPSARVDPSLLTAAGQVTVFVHGGRAEPAASAAGLRVVERYRKVGVVVATGPSRALHVLARTRGVSYVEDASLPIRFDLDHGNKAIRNPEAQAALGTPSGRLAGKGVSVAVVDTGIDGTHPFFQQEGTSKVVANLKNTCTDLGPLVAPLPELACWAPVPSNNSDTLSAGGHGTHVAGIVAGYSTPARNRFSGQTRTLAGAAPGASLVALSIGYNAKILGGTSGMNWVLEHHAAPCTGCAPIRVVNNSWGPVGGSTYCSECAAEKIQRALVAEGVVVVWAAGNDGGDGSGKDTTTRVQSQLTNGPGTDPTPGVLMVAAYDDGGTGTSDGTLADFSSRGTKGKPDTYPDLSAPGRSITSACSPTLELCNEGGDPWDGSGPSDVAAFNTLSGTSMAAPFVSGVVAELLSARPSLTPGQVEQVLENGAHRFGGDYEADPRNGGSPTSFDKGHGLLDAYAAVTLLRTVGPAAPPPPVPVQPKRVRDCNGRAWTDPAGDANGIENLVNGGPSHPNADLRGAWWEWDGRALTAVFLVQDLSEEAYSPGNVGTYVNWRTSLNGSTDVVTVVGGAASGASYYLSDDAHPGTTVTVTGWSLDRLGVGADEIHVRVTNADLAKLSPSLAVLARGARLTTQYAVGGTVPAPGTLVEVDKASGPCTVTLL